MSADPAEEEDPRARDRPNVVGFPGFPVELAPYWIPADQALEMAKGQLQEVVILGWQGDGTLWVSSSGAVRKDTVYLLNLALHKIMNGDFG